MSPRTQPVEGLRRLELAFAFGGPLPAGLAALSPEQAAVLVEAIEATRVEQDRALRAATENGLAFIPRLLRIPVKKVLFG